MEDNYVYNANLGFVNATSKISQELIGRKYNNWVTSIWGFRNLWKIGWAMTEKKPERFRIN